MVAVVRSIHTLRVDAAASLTTYPMFSSPPATDVQCHRHRWSHTLTPPSQPGDSFPATCAPLHPPLRLFEAERSKPQNLNLLLTPFSDPKNRIRFSEYEHLHHADHSGFLLLLTRHQFSFYIDCGLGTYAFIRGCASYIGQSFPASATTIFSSSPSFFTYLTFSPLSSPQ